MNKRKKINKVKRANNIENTNLNLKLINQHRQKHV
jgi:hypothetical protein